ncbi:MAG: HAD-IG family 5'-nucleotidase [Myxococcales bacterium]|nr:HAD-IG family 5'-nucleotidase [Myxococcales bacterium]MCB9700340.1 HAD-IG family 5'-nucleotidase [Myxococcales bacterium]
MSIDSGLPHAIRKLIFDAEIEVEAPHTARIFTNRDLAFERIGVIGFDMDYTLAIYRQAALETLSLECTTSKLLARGYPERITAIRSDPEFAIRGLMVDKKYGNVVKMDRHGYVGTAYHGKRLLPRAERKELYRAQRLGMEYERFAAVDTLFSLPEVNLFAEIVDLIDHAPELWGPRPPPTYAQAWNDVRECIDLSHQDDSIKGKIKADIGRYFAIDPELGPTLHKFRSAGKRLFLLTNSFYPYTDDVLRYVLGGQLATYESWHSYFDWIVVGARKPGFFTGQQPFQELDVRGKAIGEPTMEPRRGRIYQGGNQLGLQRALGVTADEVLYVGDHIYGDIVRSKKSSGWRTALIVDDLEHDLEVRRARRITLEEIEHLSQLQINLTDEISAQRYLSRLLSRMTTADLVRAGVAAEGAEALLDETRAQVRARFDRLRKYEEETAETLQRRIAEIDGAFNKYWGSVFAARKDTSRFGDQVDAYACVYTSRVTNFRFVSPVKYFHAPHGSLPHWRRSVR